VAEEQPALRGRVCQTASEVPVIETPRWSVHSKCAKTRNTSI
jgi:hypothetical protein